MSLTANDILRVTAQIKHGASATRTQGVFHWQCTDVVSAVFADIKADFAARLTALYDPMRVYYLDTAGAEGFRLIDLTKGETYGIGSWTFQGLDNAIDEVSPQVAVECVAYTFDAGRFGRKYLGPVTEPDIANGQVSAALKAATEAFGAIWNAQFAGAVTGNTYIPGVARKSGGVWVFKQFATALGILVPSGTRTQRSRTAGRGLT